MDVESLPHQQESRLEVLDTSRRYDPGDMDDKVYPESYSQETLAGFLATCLPRFEALCDVAQSKLAT